MKSKGIKRRSKRSYQDLTDPECLGKNAHKFCCNLPNYIKFVDIGWNFVIYPTHFDARYCKGDCNLQHIRNEERTKVLSHASNLNEDQRKSCCAATEMRGFSILYYERGFGVNSAILENMIVTACKCL